VACTAERHDTVRVVAASELTRHEMRRVGRPGAAGRAAIGSPHLSNEQECDGVGEIGRPIEGSFENTAFDQAMKAALK